MNIGALFLGHWLKIDGTSYSLVPIMQHCHLFQKDTSVHGGLAGASSLALSVLIGAAGTAVRSRTSS